MKILITGGTGMVGKNLREHPSLKNHEVLSPARREMDLSDYESTEIYLQKNKPDLIVHCAGKVGGIQANIKNPVAFLVENLDINRNLIMAAKNSGVTKLLNLASSCIYPRNAQNPLTESMVLQGELEPTNEGYALAKIVGARLCRYIHTEAPQFQYKTLIPCNIYGKYDKFDPAHSHLVPAIIHKVYQARKNKEPEVEIWGTGEARREFLYAGDLSDCIVRCIENFEAVPEIMNVGLGYDYSVNEYYEAVRKVIGFEGKFVHDLSKPVGMKQKLVSVDSLKKFGWSPKHTLEEGIRETYEFYLKEGN